LHVGRDEVEPEVLLRWSISNEGTRPASQVRLEFEAKGPLELMRPIAHDDDDDDGEDDSAGDGSPPKSSPSAARLPAAPKLPAFGQRVTRTQAPLPTVPKLPGGFDIASIKSARGAQAIHERRQKSGVRSVVQPKLLEVDQYGFGSRQAVERSEPAGCFQIRLFGKSCVPRDNYATRD
jgi:hypothetical protein